MRLRKAQELFQSTKSWSSIWCFWSIQHHQHQQINASLSCRMTCALDPQYILSRRPPVTWTHDLCSVAVRRCTKETPSIRAAAQESCHCSHDRYFQYSTFTINRQIQFQYIDREKEKTPCAVDWILIWVSGMISTVMHSTSRHSTQQYLLCPLNFWEARIGWTFWTRRKHNWYWGENTPLTQ